MDIENAEKKLSAIDRFLTALKLVLKKHWGILLLILLGLFIYWVTTLPPIVEPEYYPEDIEYSDQDPFSPPMVAPVVQDEYYEEPEYEDSYYEEEDY